jgi:hypothetical protein
MQKQNIGNAGEYYVASRLSAEDFIVTITLGRAEKYDILAVSPKGKTFKFSIKTRFQYDAPRFALSEKDEKGGADDFYYIFVRLHEFKKEPDFWVIPSERVNQIIYNAHKKWINGKALYGRKRNATTIRNLWLKITTTSKELYPADWEIELNGYYKNFKQLR